MSLKTVLGWLALAFVLWWIIEEPESAAAVVRDIGNFLSNAANGIARFFSSL